ncbi:MAG: succinate dehydrogenase cytochrome b subunit [Ferruginibacter sp.]|nr:succinate dehydrogenase cytochrome b subunit [Cytophagales bacterium]
MSWIAQTLTSTIGRKLLVALSGLFLITFLVIHLIGNLQLLQNDGGEAFNKYAHFMGVNPLIQTISIVNFSLILLHMVVGIGLTIRNRQARPVGYAYSRPQENSTWASRNMGLLGPIVLVFLVVHLRALWWRSKFGDIPMTSYGGDDYKDLYRITYEAFGIPWLVALYVVSMVGLAFHLSHGFASAFQTVGWRHPKYSPVIYHVGLAFSILVPAAFAAIPVFVFLKQSSWIN